MVSLWGKKGDDAENSQNGDSSDHTAENPRASEANERTHLLPPQNHDGYLSPDDPAVSFTFSLLVLRYCNSIAAQQNNFQSQQPKFPLS